METKSISLRDSIFIIVFPLLNGIVQFISGFYGGEHDEPASIPIGLYRALILIIYFFYFFIKLKNKEKLSKKIVVMAFFVLLSSLWSPDFMYSLIPSLKFFFWAASFSIGYVFITNMNKLRAYFIVYIIVHYLIFLSIILNNYFGIGIGLYNTGFKSGAGGVSVVIQLVPVLFFIPLFWRITQNRTLKVVGLILMILSLSYIIISSKRGALIGLVIGYLIYFRFTSFKSNIIKVLTSIIVAGLFVSFFFIQILLLTFEDRQHRFDLTRKENLQEEARFFEIQLVYRDFIESPEKYILGHGFFSESSSRASFYRYERQHHIDYISILYGTGLVGLFLFISHIYYFYKKSLYYQSHYSSIIYKEFSAVLIGCMTAFVFMSLSSTITQIDYRLYAYIMFGGIFRILDLQTFTVQENVKNL